VQHILQEHITGKTEFFESEHRIRNARSEWIWVRSRGKVVERDEAGNPLRIAGTARDITAGRRAERDRRIASEVLRSMGEAVAVTDLEFRFVSVNPAFSRITGYAEEEVAGQPSALLNSPHVGRGAAYLKALIRISSRLGLGGVFAPRHGRFRHLCSRHIPLAWTRPAAAPLTRGD
jgi:PAS domain-containing protein